MKRLLIILLVALVVATYAVPVLADSDSGSGDSSSDSGSDDSSNGSSDDSADDSSDDSADDSVDDSPDGSDDSVDDSVDDSPDSIDDSPDDSLHGQEVESEHTDPNELEDHILGRENEVETELESQGIEDSVRNNQKVYLVGVDAFRYVTELNPTSGDDLNQIEMELEDSLTVTTQAEMQIRSRNAVTRFFMGGDDAAAHELEQNINANEARINELEQLIGKCENCDEQVKQQLNDMIQEMDQEQERLRELSHLELQDRGILGWIWK